MNNVIEVEDLSVSYHIKPVLWDVDLNVKQGSLMAIIGPNGAGKSTLLKAMLGLLKPVSGEVRYLSTNKTKDIAYVPQSASIDWDFPITVLDVVIMGRYGSLGWIKRPKVKDKEIALEKLELVGMKEYKDRQICQLSGGQQQRVFLARALAQDASIYFMDEPFKGVDVQTEKTMIKIMKDLQALNKTLIVVHHDLDSVTKIFDYVTLLNVQVIASGKTSDVFTQENIDTTYRKPFEVIKGKIV